MTFIMGNAFSEIVSKLKLWPRTDKLLNASSGNGAAEPDVIVSVSRSIIPIGIPPARISAVVPITANDEPPGDP